MERSIQRDFSATFHSLDCAFPPKYTYLDLDLGTCFKNLDLDLRVYIVTGRRVGIPTLDLLDL